jgi:hypothetical protein
MHTPRSVRATGLAFLCAALVWFVAACAAPPTPTQPTPTGPVEGVVTEGGLFGMAGVVVRAQGQTTLTDGQGRFTLPDVALPYDLSLSQTSGDGWLHVIEGLTDRAPVIDPLAATVSFGSPPSTDISGPLSGGGAWPLPAGRRAVVCVEGLDVVVFGCDTVSFAEASFSLTANLLFEDAATVRLHGLRMVVGGDGRPTGYEGYGFVDVAIEGGVPIVVPLNLGVAPAVGDFEVAFDVPGGASLATVLVMLRLGDAGALFLFQEAVAGDTLTFPVPVMPGARYAVFAVADTGTGSSTSWRIADDPDVGTLDFGIPPQLTAPVNAATDATATTPFESCPAPSDT